MITENSLKNLDASYRSKDTKDNASVYNNWAQTYDQEMGSMGYVNPAITPAIIERHAKNKDAKILDVGCATGQVGSYLYFIGFNNLHAIDHSHEMVKVADSKKVYQTVQQASLEPNKTLPFANEEFDIVLPMGIFTVGHAPVEGIDELLRICKTGGHVIFSCTEPGWKLHGFGGKIEQLEASNKWKRIDQTREYITIPGASTDRLYKSVIYVYEKL